MSQIDSLIQLLFDGEETSIECDEINQVENLFFAAATSGSSEVHKPIDFTSTEATNIESNFQAVLKRQLQTQVESHPPVFPWETEVADYPDYEDTTPSLKLVCSGSIIEQSIVEAACLAPQKSLGQWLLAVNQTLVVKLVQTVESFFLKKAQNLKGLADSVTKNLYWSASVGNGQDANSMESPSKLIGDNPNQARSYMKILTVPFFQTYVVGMKKRYLNALFVKAISNPAMRLKLIQMN